MARPPPNFCKQGAYSCPAALSGPLRARARVGNQAAICCSSSAAARGLGLPAFKLFPTHRSWEQGSPMGTPEVAAWAKGAGGGSALDSPGPDTAAGEEEFEDRGAMCVRGQGSEGGPVQFAGSCIRRAPAPWLIRCAPNLLILLARGAATARGSTAALGTKT